YRMKIECRAADDLEHVGGGGLLLQRFAKLVEQPGVLDGNDSLGGEVLDQLDLFVAEGAHLLAENRNRTDQLSLLEHRDRDQSPSACEVNESDEGRIALDVGLLKGNIGD